MGQNPCGNWMSHITVFSRFFCLTKPCTKIIRFLNFIFFKKNKTKLVPHLLGKSFSEWWSCSVSFPAAPELDQELRCSKINIEAVLITYFQGKWPKQINQQKTVFYCKLKSWTKTRLCEWVAKSGALKLNKFPLIWLSPFTACRLH